MDFKLDDVVVIPDRLQYPSRVPVVGYISHVRKGWTDREHPSPHSLYYVSFVSKGDIGCASLYRGEELKMAPLKFQKKYTRTYIRKLFGKCFTKGCNDKCIHISSGGWKTAKS